MNFEDKNLGYSDKQINDMIDYLNKDALTLAAGPGSERELRHAHALITLKQNGVKPEGTAANSINVAGDVNLYAPDVSDLIDLDVKPLKNPAVGTDAYNHAYADLNFGANYNNRPKDSQLYQTAAAHVGIPIKMGHAVENKYNDWYADRQDNIAAAKAENTAPSRLHQTLASELDQKTENLVWSKYGRAGNPEAMKILAEYKRNPELAKRYLQLADNGWQERANAGVARADIHNNNQVNVLQAGSHTLNYIPRAVMSSWADYHDGIRQQKMAANKPNPGLQALKRTVPNMTYQQAMRQNADASIETQDGLHRYYNAPDSEKTAVLDSFDQSDQGKRYGETAHGARDWMGRNLPLSPGLENNALANFPGSVVGVAADAASFLPLAARTGLGPNASRTALGVERELNRQKGIVLNPDTADLARDSTFRNPNTYVELGSGLLTGGRTAFGKELANSAMGQKVAAMAQNSTAGQIRQGYRNKVNPRLRKFTDGVFGISSNYLNKGYQNEIDNRQRMRVGLERQRFAPDATDYILKQYKDDYFNQLKLRYPEYFRSQY